MRAIDKGNSPKAYSSYRDARPDLASLIGYYCSYCEMGTNNMIEVEHVHPVHNGGNELNWNNFLLSCKYCNTVKSNNNQDRNGYFWPDIDNTDLLFNYTLDIYVLEIKKGVLSPTQEANAQALIKLVGLNRYPGSSNEPTEADTRWRLRDETTITAMSSFNRWCLLINEPDNNPLKIMLAEQIADTSTVGFYSIWCKIFENEPMVLNKIDKLWETRFRNFKKFDQTNNSRIIRPGGNI